MIASGKRFEGSKGIGVTTLAQLKYNILLVKKSKEEFGGISENGKEVGGDCGVGVSVSVIFKRCFDFF